MKRIAFGCFSSALEHLLQALLEVAAIARAGEQRAHIERVDLGASAALGGTSPSAMRSARPSASAVLPTPGSPTSSGLFLRRRHSTWIDRARAPAAADQRIDLPAARLRHQFDGVGRERIACGAPLVALRPCARRGRLLGRRARSPSAAAAGSRPASSGSRRRGCPLPAAGTPAGCRCRPRGARRGGVHDGTLHHAVEADGRFGLDRLVPGTGVWARSSTSSRSCVAARDRR